MARIAVLGHYEPVRTLAIAPGETLTVEEAVEKVGFNVDFGAMSVRINGRTARPADLIHEDSLVTLVPQIKGGR